MLGLKATYSTSKVMFFQGQSRTAKEEFLKTYPHVVKNFTNGGCLYSASTGEELLEVDRSRQHYLLRVPRRKLGSEKMPTATVRETIHPKHSSRG